MKQIDWREDYSVGDEKIDRHNRHLVELMKQAQEVLLEAPRHIAGSNLIDEFVDYLFYHFASEEVWMRRRRLPQLSRHVEDHLRCTAVIVEKTKRYHAGAISPLEMLSEIFDTVISHVRSFDAAYASVKE